MPAIVVAVFSIFAAFLPRRLPGGRLRNYSALRLAALLVPARELAADHCARRATDAGADDAALVAAGLLADRRPGRATRRAADDRTALPLAARADRRARCAADRAADHGSGRAPAGLL